jgi:putative transposase
LAYKLSYREIDEILAKRNIHFDHSTLNRWVIKYSPQLAANFRTRKRKVADSWRMDETYLKLKLKGNGFAIIERLIQMVLLLIFT